jgi:hypothetical protein
MRRPCERTKRYRTLLYHIDALMVPRALTPSVSTPVEVVPGGEADHAAAKRQGRADEPDHGAEQSVAVLVKPASRLAHSSPSGANTAAPGTVERDEERQLMMKLVSRSRLRAAVWRGRGGPGNYRDPKPATRAASRAAAGTPKPALLDKAAVRA